DLYAGGLRARLALARQVHIDDRDRIAFGIVFQVALPCRDSDQLAVGARRNPERAGLQRNARRDLDNRNALEGLIEVHDGDVLGAAIAGEQIALAIAALAERDRFRIGPTSELLER